LRDRIRTWQQQGVEVVLIGNGNRTFAEAFREEFELEGRLLVDPDLHAYRAAGLRRGRRELASPWLAAQAIRALRSGARQTGVQGDPWQLGGVLVFGPGGELRFRHVAETAGDHAAPEEIEAALDEDAEPIEEERASATPLASAVDALRPALDLTPLLSFDRIGFQRHALGFDPGDLDVDLYGRRCAITGGASGVGRAAALALADLGAEVLLLCGPREPAMDATKSIREATGNARVRQVECDLADPDSIEEALHALGPDPLDVLIHAAEILPTERVETVTGRELAFATHVAGPHRLTRGAASRLEASDDARIVWVSSSALYTRPLEVDDPDWREREYDAWVAFAETRRAQVAMARLWAEAFDGGAVRVQAMHPGWVDTPIVRSVIPRLLQIAMPVLRTPEEGADTAVWLAASSAVEDGSGDLYFDRRVVRPHWLPLRQESSGDRERLWQLCESD
jgi:NAD(P)-dependent dehydrogenase (short-subunit alcohol dehydrogenase family)